MWFFCFICHITQSSHQGCSFLICYTSVWYTCVCSDSLFINLFALKRPIGQGCYKYTPTKSVGICICACRRIFNGNYSGVKKWHWILNIQITYIFINFNTILNLSQSKFWKFIQLFIVHWYACSVPCLIFSYFSGIL